MELTGQLWFTFGSTEVWHFYRFVLRVAETGSEVGLEWSPLPNGDEDLAMSVYLTLDNPTSRGKFLHSMLGLIHIEGRSAADSDVVREAIEVAGISVSEVAIDRSRLDGVSAIAEDIGVGATPSLYRHGPPMTIILTPAALIDDPSDTLRTILGASSDDGIWELRKP